MPSITLKGKGTFWVNEKDCEVEGDWHDHGIGAYEFWGAKGNHKDVCFDIESVSISKAEDEEGNEITNPTILKELEDAVPENDEEWAKLSNSYDNERDYEPAED